MSEIFKEKTVNAFVKLGEFLKNPNDEFKTLILNAKNQNAWFNEFEVNRAIRANASMLNRDDIEIWLSNLKSENNNPKKIGLILAGNIPLVGFHDILTVLATGNIALIKVSSQDSLLIPAVLNKLIEIEQNFKNQIQFIDRLVNFDAVIATGSNNSSRYFDYYFSKVPNIIRKNRNSVALLTGDESTADLKQLGEDIFNYYGLGCRNISKLYVPKGYIFNHFFESIEEYSSILNHHKYQNNYDYNKSIYLVNKNEHLDNGFLLVKRDENLTSPLAVLFFEEYENLSDVVNKLNARATEIQVIVTSASVNLVIPQVSFGESQSPKLWDYADGINTLEFLKNI